MSNHFYHLLKEIYIYKSSNYTLGIDYADHLSMDADNIKQEPR